MPRPASGTSFLIAVAAVGFQVPPHGVALAVLFGELVAIAQPSTVAPLRLAPATA
ncbi:hypothetical protein [Streptomyces sp. NPDC001037]|uniref:hypothetical protein n=1 Tax=Streptomyces sp. NPDC001037 TaxID=3364542 RepID=UPI0036842DE3